MAGSGFSLKDQLFNADKVTMLSGWMAAASPAFEAGAFEAQVMARLPELELKQRIDWIAECLMAQLPERFEAAAGLIEAALPPALDPTRTDDDFGDFILAPFGVVVERMGLDAPELSLDLFEALTQRFSMELSIRSFLNAWPEEVLARMDRWVGHENYHVRRLVSEGTRPRLPWAKKITLDPDRALPLLDRLHGDPTRYVTRSVANHLNDVAKLKPQVAVDLLADWRAQGRQTSREMDWMSRHALRTLIKAGDGRAMAFLGYRPEPQVELVALDVSPQVVPIGGAAEIAVTLRAAREEPVIVDYLVEFVRPSGRGGAKVFKLKTTVLPAGQTVTLRKRHVFKGDATTFRLYPGTHGLKVQVNGRQLGAASFELTV